MLYEDDSGEKKCNKCHHNCKTCTGKRDIDCLTCDGEDKREKYYTECVCIKDHVAEKNEKKCKPLDKLN